jgi:hypothetical protein
MSNRTYQPDKWVIIKIWNKTTADEQPIYKVLGVWLGGFAEPDYWRLSSGVQSITKEDGVYTIPQFSGSTYVVHENDERMNATMASTFADFEQELRGRGDIHGITVISIKELIEALAITT